MNLRNGLIGIGLGIGFMGGGAFSLANGFHELHVADQEQACTLTQFASKAICQNVITTKEIRTHTSDEAQTLFWIGGIAMIGGALGVFSVYEGLAE